MRISDWSSDVCSSDLVDHRPAIVGEHAARKSELGLHAFVIDIRGFGRLIQREQPVAAHLDEPVEPGGEPDDHRTLQRETRVRRRRFGDGREIRGLEARSEERSYGKACVRTVSIWWSPIPY